MFQRRKSAIFPSRTMRTASSLPTLTPSRFSTLLLIFFILLSLYLLLPHQSFTPTPTFHHSRAFLSPTTRRHLLFAIAASSQSWPRRHSYVRLWYSPNSTRAVTFLDRPVAAAYHYQDLPPVIVSGDTSRFPYTFKKGLRSAIRVARVVKEAVDRNDSDVRWYVFGDDDTVFFVDNLVGTLSKYNHERWFYVGSSSESYEQNEQYSFDMAFGGGGFAISQSLARVLSRVFDSCLMRYGHLYGSDSRIFSCLAELGVRLTREPGFHQVDIRGNLFGLLSAHPLSPLVSLHHLDAIDPVFPNMNRTKGMEHLFKAVKADSARVLHQAVCYDRSNILTISVAWGYAIQVFEGNELLPDLLSVQKSFTPWRRGASVVSHYMFNTRDYPKDHCKRPVVFFLDSITSDSEGIRSKYTRYSQNGCFRTDTVKNLQQIIVLSQKLELDTEQMKAPRRQCCDIDPSFNESALINIRDCGPDELISMHF